MIEATDQLYLENKRTIEKACWSCWRKNPIIQLDDYRSYANEIFMDATRTFDDSKGAKFNSWLTTQLLRLRGYAGSFKEHSRAASGTEHLVGSLDEASEKLEGKSCTLGDLRSHFGDSYAAKLQVPEWALSWWDRLDNLKPYLGELSEDAKELTNDILDGVVSKRDSLGRPLPERTKAYYVELSPRQLYIRRYHKKGWTLDRVIAARKSVQELLEKHSKLVSKKSESSDCELVQDELF